jgi:hypothetical protein
MSHSIDEKTRDEIRKAATKGELFAYFGYGSLVNRDTHRTRTLGAVKATVNGWRRHWQGRSYHSDDFHSMLSVKPDVSHDLPGLLVFDHITSLQAMDEREGGYDRRVIDPARLKIEADLDFDGPVYIYEGRAPMVNGQRHGILQSYLDAVLQGYMNEYGQDHVVRFLTETHAFDNTPVIKDRHAPRYSRPVRLGDKERDLFDELLRSHGVAHTDTV